MLNGAYLTTYVTCGVASVGVNVRIYLAYICALITSSVAVVIVDVIGYLTGSITNITISIAVVIVDVRTYFACVSAYVTCGIASVIVVVLCYIVYLSALITNAPVICRIFRVNCVIRMLGNSTLVSAGVTGSITIIVILVSFYVTYILAYLTNAPVICRVSGIG
jgi:hypothetical protein